MGRSFNGSSDKILATTVAASGSFTLSFWAQAATTSGTQTAVYDGNDASNGFGIQTVDGAGHVRGVIGTAGNVTSTQAPSTTAWAHYALVNNAGAQTLYYNGSSIGTASLTPVAPSGGKLSIGVGTTTNFYNGLVADVAVWNVALSSSEISQLAAGYRPVDAHSANLQFWMPLSGYSSPEPDLSGNANNGTLTGTSQAAMPPSISRGGRNFNGSNTILASFNTFPTAAFSYSAWINVTGRVTYGAVSSSNGSGVGFGVFQNSNRMAWYTGIPPSVDPGATNINLGTWYHVAMTYDSVGGLKTYVNGANDGTAAASGTANAGTGFPIGYDNVTAGRNFNGIIADVAIWNTALSSGNITSLYNGVRPGNVAAGNLVGWWPLDGFSNATESDRSGSGNNGTVTGAVPNLGPPQLWRLSA